MFRLPVGPMLLAIAFAATPAMAEEITAGSIVLTHFASGDATVSLSSVNDSLTGTFVDGGAFVCSPCERGPHEIRAFWGGDMGSGAGTVDGTWYPSIFFGGSFGVTGTALVPNQAAGSPFDLRFGFTVDDGSFLTG